MEEFIQQTFIGIYRTSGTVLWARSTAVSNSERKRERGTRIGKREMQEEQEEEQEDVKEVEVKGREGRSSDTFANNYSSLF